MKVIESHGFAKIANASIMDSEDEIKLPVNKGKHLEYDLVGNCFTKYDSIINLAHINVICWVDLGLGSTKYELINID